MRPDQTHMWTETLKCAEEKKERAVVSFLGPFEAQSSNNGLRFHWELTPGAALRTHMGIVATQSRSVFVRLVVELCLVG